MKVDEIKTDEVELSKPTEPETPASSITIAEPEKSILPPRKKVKRRKKVKDGPKHPLTGKLICGFLLAVIGNWS